MSSSTSECHSDGENDAPVKGQYHKNKTNVYVKNFGNEMTDQKLCKLFGMYGKITSCKIEKNKFGQSKGFGFVNFLTSSMAEDAIDNLHDHQLENGKRLFVCFFQSKKDRIKEQQQTFHKTCEDRNLYIGNLDESIDDQALKLAFATYGTITSARVMVKQQGRSKGYGFVCFSTADEASAAIEGMDGQELGSKPVHVTWEKPPNERSQKPIDTQQSYSSFVPRNITNYSQTDDLHFALPLQTPSFLNPNALNFDFEVWNENAVENVNLPSQIPPPIQFSTRLSSRLQTPISQYPSPVHSKENHQFSSLHLAVSQWKNSPPSTEDEKSDPE